MSDKKYTVPAEGLKAAVEVARKMEGYPHPDGEETKRLTEKVKAILEEGFIRWQSESPLVPTSKQESELLDSWIKESWLGKTEHLVTEWQRRMYLAPEPEVPEEIKDLLWPNSRSASDLDRAVIEAYRRGKASR